MTQEEIIEGNKLIAEFMDYKVSEDEVKDENGFWINLQDTFHTSWDWLMPVYSKAMQGTENDGGDEYFDLQNYFEDAAMNNRIDLAFSAVIEFIKWYSSNKDNNG